MVHDIRTLLPPLYAIVDAGCFASAPQPLEALAQHVRELIAGGARLLQYRNKSGDARQMLAQARELRRLVSAGEPAPGAPIRLIMNDRADLCVAAGFGGVHVGQDDLSPAAVRAVVGERLWVGVSTHNPEQVREADQQPVDYIAVGPVFATPTKANPDPVIGLEGVRRARELTSKPLVAIGGITRANCRSVVDVGADSVAVISDLLQEPRRAAEQFLALLR
jgi:thiamine-phosphate pyrophosphorylase